MFESTKKRIYIVSSYAHFMKKYKFIKRETKKKSRLCVIYLSIYDIWCHIWTMAYNMYNDNFYLYFEKTRVKHFLYLITEQSKKYLSW